ncbi:MAG: CZB domain-containing protein [Acidobacteria bacterium]|nr:CZB domain-containing protein [Acidobacteriota bacterium]MCB9396583.1 CZB domain-containing protein [Acidobacteriota bacterium]
MIRNELVRLIGSHALWRADLIKAVQAGHIAADALEILDDSNCDLGLCLQGLKEPDLADLIQATHSAHLVFHAIAAQIVRLIEKGRIGDAGMLLRADGPFFHASSELIHCLNRVQEQLPSAPNGLVPDFQLIQKLKEP